MADALSFTEVERQYVELLPARTVLSLVCGTAGTAGAGSTAATPTGASGTGVAGSGTATFTANTIFIFLANNQYNTFTGGASGTGAATGTGGAATGGAG